MKEDCKYYYDCRKPVELCNTQCVDYISVKELQREIKNQNTEDLKNYWSNEYH